MSKKNKKRYPWGQTRPTAQPSSAAAIAAPANEAPAPKFEPDSSSISPAQLAANRANAQLSTGPRTEAGLANSSKNALKTALTGQTVLLPGDDLEEYTAVMAEYERDLKPVGQLEREVVQTIVDCYWRLRRIQELEYALYAHGKEQFADAFPNASPLERHSKIILQTHLTYEKQLRNLHIQEARIDRKRTKAIAELKALQAERSEQSTGSELDAFPNESELFAALDAGFLPPSVRAQWERQAQPDANGFDFSNAEIATPNTSEQEAA
jgi:hypothetical protein